MTKKNLFAMPYALFKLSGNINRFLKESVDMYKRKCYPTACFLAITAIEENAKFYLLAEKYYRGEEITQALIDSLKYKRNKINPHSLKHIVGILRGLVFNSHAINLYGKDIIDQSTKLLEDGKLLKIRNLCLYVDLENSSIKYPYKEIKYDKAAKIIAYAHEATANICHLISNRTKTDREYKRFHYFAIGIENESKVFKLFLGKKIANLGHNQSF